MGVKKEGASRIGSYLVENSDSQSSRVPAPWKTLTYRNCIGFSPSVARAWFAHCGFTVPFTESYGLYVMSVSRAPLFERKRGVFDEFSGSKPDEQKNVFQVHDKNQGRRCA